MWGDFHYDSTQAWIRQRDEREAKKKAAEAAAVERRKAAAAALEPVLRKAEAGDVASMREVIRLLAEAHDVTWNIRAEMPAGAAAYACWQTRTITTRPIEGAETFSEALHELGHVLAGKCSGVEPHRPDRSVTRWHHCVKCEVDAWLEAQKLVPFSREMFERLQSALRTYRRTTPAAAAEIARLDCVAGSVTWAEQKTNRLKAARFAELQARLDRARGEAK